MNIVVGICGLGYGHCIRQAQIIPEIMQRGHRVITFGYLNSTEFIKQHFPDLVHFDIRRPWLPPAAHGLDLDAIAHDPRNRFDDAIAINFGAMSQVLSLFGGPPDLVISDYCPVVSDLAFVTCRPLVTVDNQSKFLAYEFPDVDGWSRYQEVCRLNLYFPHADLRVATSKFETPWKPDARFQVRMVAPILRPEIRKYARHAISFESDKIIVYLSRYPAVQNRDRQALPDFISVFHQFPRYRFHVVCHEIEHQINGNVSVRPFTSAEAFAQQLSSAAAVIGTAGEGTIAEALHLGKPMLAVPMATYEQKYNAYELAKFGLGLSSDTINEDALGTFICRLSEFRGNIEAASRERRILIDGDGVREFLALLEQRYGV